MLDGSLTIRPSFRRARASAKAASSAATESAVTSCEGAERPAAQGVERDVDDGNLGLDRVRWILATQAGLEGDERQDRPVPPREDLAIEDAGPRQGGGPPDDLG